MMPLEDRIKKLGTPLVLRKDEFLFNAEDEAKGFYYLLSGEVRVFRMDEQGREVEVVRIGPGDFLGEAIVFVTTKFPSYAQAVQDSQLLFFAKDKFFHKLESEPSIAKFFLTLLAKKCVVLNKRIEALELQTVRERLIRYLVTSAKGSKQCLIELPMKKGELAKLLGTISETLSRNLKQLQTEGLISVKGNTIQIHDCLGLKEELGAII
ncbi:Crp/Fnr family transcriptional regulator [Acidobacteriota bacterium]